MAGDEATDELVDALVQTSFVTMATLTRIGAAHDLSLTQLRVLAILRDRRPSMTTLAAYLGLEKSTMSGLVDRGERRGLLERIPNPLDRRGVAVGLTPAGESLADEVREQVIDALGPMVGGLSGPSRGRLRGLLRRILEAEKH